MFKRFAIAAAVGTLATTFASGAAASAAQVESPAPAARGKVLVNSSKIDKLASAQWFRNQSTGYCMTALGYGLGRIEAHPCEYSNPYFLWDVRRWADGTRELRSHHPLYHNGCIDAASTGEGQTVILEQCNASTWQSWYVDAWSDGTIRFRNQRTGLCLSHWLGDYFIVTQQKCDTSEHESWY